MRLLTRYPRLGAWIVVIVLVGAATLTALQGTRALEAPTPAHLSYIHGLIVAIRPGNEFGVRVAGHSAVMWFQVARGARVSLAHLQRHLHEGAPTDVYYQNQQRGLPLAWVAD
jgi:hypothetical protein